MVDPKEFEQGPEDEEDGASSPPSTAGTSSKTDDPDEERRLQSQRSKEGRERASKVQARLAETERQNQLLQRQVAQQNQHLNHLGAQLTAMQQRQQDEYLASLPDDERTRAELEILKKRVQTAEARPQPVAPPSSPQLTQEQVEERGQAILDKINKQYGTDLTVETHYEELDWDNPRRFEASARSQAALRKAEMLSEGKERTEVPKNETARDDARERVDKQAARDLGMSSPLSPRPVPRRKAEPVTSESLKEIAGGYRTKIGPKAQMAKLKEAKERALSQLPRT